MNRQSASTIENRQSAIGGLQSIASLEMKALQPETCNLQLETGNWKPVNLQPEITNLIQNIAL